MLLSQELEYLDNFIALQKLRFTEQDQVQISFEKNVAKIGQTYKVLFDRKEGGYFVGRTASDSPEVDNEVLVPATENYVRIGDFAMVEIVDAQEFDLFGQV